MHFTANQIEMARLLRDAGLPWKPGPGQFVYDEAGLIDAPSPFQPRVYFILDLRHFVRRAGTLARLRAGMFWLPHWHQARELLRIQGVTDAELAESLAHERVFECGDELATLYRWIYDALAARSCSAG